MSSRRIFFGMEVCAPWPDDYPPGRLIEIQNRHLTLAFLGSIPDEEFQRLLNLLDKLPILVFKLGLLGKFDQPLFLAHALSWHVDIEKEPLTSFQRKLIAFLKEHKFKCEEKHSFNPHVTLAREPYDRREWKKSFAPLPLYLGTIHLYESMGHSHYESRKAWPILPPFEAIEHTADIGYLVRGKNLKDLYRSASFALAFVFPSFLNYIEDEEIKIFDDIVLKLNDKVAKADTEIGCPFKAVSYHGDLKEKEGFYEWEMIVDV